MAELSAYQATVRRIHADDSLNPKAKRKQLSRLTRKPEWIRAHSLFWGGLAASAMDLALDPLADLAVGRLEPFDGNAITEYPVFKNPDGNRQAKFIETSTPGLRGQSGGPIFDADANVWAIQSRTMSLPLGFSPVVKQGNKEIIEHQFMHVGWGSHVEEVIRMLTDRQIRFALSQ